MNPLEKVSQSFENGIIPKTTYELIQKRFSLVLDGIMRIEKASSIKYPIVYVEPSIVISAGFSVLSKSPVHSLNSQPVFPVAVSSTTVPLL